MDVLVVDDEEDVRVLFELYLRGRGHGVTVVGSGAAARSALEADTFDVLVLDLSLPDAIGAQFAAELRDAGLLPRHVVLASGTRPAVLGELATSMGAAPLAKPFTVDELDGVFAGLDDAEGKAVGPE